MSVIFIPEDPKVGVGAVIWAKGQSVSSLSLPLLRCDYLISSVENRCNSIVFFTDAVKLLSCPRLAVMEQGVCTWWVAVTTLTQQARSTQSTHKWTTNKKTDRDANTDTSSTQSRTPSPSGQNTHFLGYAMVSFKQRLTKMFLLMLLGLEISNQRCPPCCL